jgi:hypothetical protein
MIKAFGALAAAGTDQAVLQQVFILLQQVLELQL